MSTASGIQARPESVSVATQVVILSRTLRFLSGNSHDAEYETEECALLEGINDRISRALGFAIFRTHDLNPYHARPEGFLQAPSIDRDLSPDGRSVVLHIGIDDPGRFLCADYDITLQLRGRVRLSYGLPTVAELEVSAVPLPGAPSLWDSPGESPSPLGEALGAWVARLRSAVESELDSEG